MSWWPLQLFSPLRVRLQLSSAALQTFRQWNGGRRPWTCARSSFASSVCVLMHLQLPASLQVRQAHKDIKREEKVLIQMWLLFGFLLECFHGSLLDVWILKQIYLKPKVGKTLHSCFFINSDLDSFPFGINQCRDEIQKTKKRKAMPNK